MRLRPAVPIAIYYFAFFAALGVFLPYFSLYLVSAGLSSPTATRVQAVLPLMNVAIPPLLGLVADARRARGWLLRALSVATAATFALFYLANGRPIAVFVVVALFAACRAPLTSLVDASAFEVVRATGGSYGRLRLWGSLGFLCAVLAGGWLAQRAGSAFVLSSTTCALVAAAVCSWGVPAPPPAPNPAARAAVSAMLRRPAPWIFFAAVALGQGSLSAYDAGFTLHLRALGYGGAFTGVAWGIGVVAEILVFTAGARLLARFRAETLLVVALAVSAVRWFATAHVRGAAGVLCLQPLHAFTFGLYWLSVTAIARTLAGDDAPTTGQGLLAAALGVGSVPGMAVVGTLLVQTGSKGLYTIAGAVALAAALAALAYALATRVRPKSDL